LTYNVGLIIIQYNIRVWMFSGY